MLNYTEIARLHLVWRNMKSRCLQPSNKQYADYGGRGIEICPEWLNFDTFADWAYTHGSGPGLHMDRTDNDGPYSPDNCTFVTPTWNARNKRNNRWITAFGETKVLSAWESDKRCLVSAPTLRKRLKAGWNTEEAFTIKRARNRQSGFFKCGHPMLESNVYRRSGSGYRICKTCAKMAAHEQSIVMQKKRKAAGQYD
jgi:hypothetical protein